MHNINKMVYVGIEPWHGLGVRLPANATYQQIAELAGFYIAEEKQLLVEGSNITVPDRKAVVRGDDGRYLATVGSGYRIVQFAEVAKTLVEAASMVDGFFHTAGTLGPVGARGWLLGELPGDIIVRGDPSPIKKYQEVPVASHITFGDLMKKWWAEYGPILRSKTIQPFAEKHLRGELGNKMLGEITTGTLEALLNKKTSVLSAQSRNHLRSYLKRLYNYAARRDLWRGANPAAALDKAKLPKRPPSYLRPDEIAKVLDQLEPRWKAIFATAFFTGMRKGELLALKKIDVDLVNGTITVRRSNNFDTTKGQHEEELPIANELRPYLVIAMTESKSDLVFPRPDGTQHPGDLPLHKVLRRAMGRAGIVDGYLHVCRRKACGFKQQREANTESTCPTCSMKLWVKPIPRQLRFHDTRHSTAALLLKAKVPLAIVQKVLRHSDPAITSNVYGNIGLDDMRDAVNTMGDQVRPHLRIAGTAVGSEYAEDHKHHRDGQAHDQSATTEDSKSHRK